MKHLIYLGESLTDPNHKLIEVPTSEYIKLRLQIWKWYKHRTMGRPILMLRRPGDANT